MTRLIFQKMFHAISSLQELFSINPCQHPIVILKDISYNDLKAIVDFIYLGEINVSHDHLQSVIKVNEFQVTYYLFIGANISRLIYFNRPQKRLTLKV